MPVDQHAFLASVEQMRLRASELEDELIQLHHSATFDPSMPGVAQRARRIETRARELAAGVEAICARLPPGRAEG